MTKYSGARCETCGKEFGADSTYIEVYYEKARYCNETCYRQRNNMNDQKVDYIINNILMRLDKMTAHMTQLNNSIYQIKMELASLCVREKESKDYQFNRRDLSQLVKRFLDEDFDI